MGKQRTRGPLDKGLLLPRASSCCPPIAATTVLFTISPVSVASVTFFVLFYYLFCLSSFLFFPLFFFLSSFFSLHKLLCERKLCYLFVAVKFVRVLAQVAAPKFEGGRLMGGVRATVSAVFSVASLKPISPALGGIGPCKDAGEGTRIPVG